MSHASALLLENVHTTASEALQAVGMTVERRAKGLEEQELIDALRALGPGPVMVGLRSKTRVTRAVFEAVPNLVAIGAFCIGTDQIDLDEARARGVAVFNAPFSSTRSVAELVLGELIVLSRQVMVKNAACHRGQWLKNASGANEVRGKTLGIIGYGHIGSQLSVLAEAIGMTVRFFDIEPKLPLGNADAAGSLQELLGAADFVSLHVPDTERTRGMIGAQELAQMRADAYLVNASRGQVVDLDALKDALDRGHVAGAALDVFPEEPAREGDEFVNILRGDDRVIMTPHIGGSTQEAQANIGREVALALANYWTAGSTLGSVTLPPLDAGPFFHDRVGRVVNAHRNVPGVLGALNGAITQMGLNVVAQHLATRDQQGLVIVDVDTGGDASLVQALRDAIEALPASVRTRAL